MEKHEKILTTYKRNHQDGDIRENESAKIVKEKGKAHQLGRKAERLIDSLLIDEDGDDRYAQLQHEAKKTSGNARTHRDRLRELSKNDELR